MIDVLICTVGTSLKQNIDNLRSNNTEDNPLNTRFIEAYDEAQWQSIGNTLRGLDPQNRLCGAEINSIDSISRHRNLIGENTQIFFLHSDTDDGENISRILCAYYAGRSEAIRVEELQDADPKAFRTKGLRNLAKQMCKIIHENQVLRSRNCAINATGGYKAQIAIAVLIGQALRVPVYYKHERFDEVIEFPPMPVSLDFQLWMRVSGLLYALDGTSEPLKRSEYSEIIDNENSVESLINTEQIDGVDYIELSPVGQIFHEAYREQFSSSRDRILPPPVPPYEKRDPRW
ncbi:TPA: putative CRISPR-associated protein, partial [bacterium]|nr:putative CRISPR-associated protein [bacterium]